jgi:hypothetical protein
MAHFIKEGAACASIRMRPYVDWQNARSAGRFPERRSFEQGHQEIPCGLGISRRLDGHGVQVAELPLQWQEGDGLFRLGSG